MLHYFSSSDDSSTSSSGEDNMNPLRKAHFYFSVALFAVAGIAIIRSYVTYHSSPVTYKDNDDDPPPLYKGFPPPPYKELHHHI